jgi:aminoglycoside 2'-N-acetyltransferase I
MGMAQLRRTHTAELSAAQLGEVRRLLDAAFAGRFGDDDWEHTLGGVHFLVLEQDELVGHVAVVQRRLVHRNRAVRTGYVEGLAVRGDRRRRGHAAAAMAEAERLIERAYDLGGLSDGTGIEGYYQRRGWLAWAGPTFVLGPDGPRWTPEEDGTVLLRRTPTSPELDLSAPLGCDWRPGDAW